MAGNRFLVASLVFVIVSTFTPFSTFADEISASESHEHEAENAAVDVKEDVHVDSQEHTSEEHSSHESAGVEHEVLGGEAPEHEHIREAEGPHVHNSATAEAVRWVAIGTLIAAASILGIKSRTRNKVANYRFVVLSLAAGAGVTHLLLVPDHFVDVSMEHAKFFAATGIAQISFGILFMLRPSRRFAITGIIGNIGSIALYWITRIENLPAPFGAPEGIDPVGIVTKIVEISLVGLLVYLVLQYRKVRSVEVSRA